MKLIIQIPCYNEEKTLPQTIKDLPKRIEGIDKLEYLIIDDGSTDNTVKVAKSLGIKYIVSITPNKGLANAFKTGLEYSLNHGADIIVNTDADNQYKGEDIEKLVTPIIEKKAEIVIGERPILNHPEWGTIKKILQKLGSWTVRKISQTSIPDVPSGFRAYSKDAVLHLNIFSRYSYTIETIIQAGQKKIPMISVPIRINPKTRESRLFKSIFHYIKRSIEIILQNFMVYSPFKFFSMLSVVFFFISSGFLTRFIYMVINHPELTMKTFLLSFLVSVFSFMISIFLFIAGIVAQLISYNRKLNEEILYIVKKQNTKNNI